jgi:hypothetical protein
MNTFFEEGFCNFLNDLTSIKITIPNKNEQLNDLKRCNKLFSSIWHYVWKIMLYILLLLR